MVERLTVAHKRFTKDVDLINHFLIIMFVYLASGLFSIWYGNGITQYAPVALVVFFVSVLEDRTQPIEAAFILTIIYGYALLAGVGVGLLFMGVLIQVFAEEYFFRGWLFSRLTERAGVVSGIMLSTALFVALHALNPGFGASYALISVAFGGLMCAITWRTGSIWLAVALHLVWNLSVL